MGLGWFLGRPAAVASSTLTGRSSWHLHDPIGHSAALLTQLCCTPAIGLASPADLSPRQPSDGRLGSSGADVPLLQPLGCAEGGWLGTPTGDAGGAQAGCLEAAATLHWCVNK